MFCVITAGPTYEPLDDVRRLTNFSTGELGSRLAQYLAKRGHEITLFRSSTAVARAPANLQSVRSFTTTADLQAQLKALAKQPVEALFHAAAVCDFAPGRIYEPTPDGRLLEVKARKIATGFRSLLVELQPTAKIIGHLRDWFPRALLVGWKYEPDGDRTSALAKAEIQLQANRTNACVANGPAYGLGFGLVRSGREPLHLKSRLELFQQLAGLIE
ncbi:MAG: DNA/pantothenate metabolism flavoprotein domain protein [Pedosphaera parvula]|nr:DNA/pantothenate metabolism flavoprotein domain protein [Pedosphaera parvula]